VNGVKQTARVVYIGPNITLHSSNVHVYMHGLFVSNGCFFTKGLILGLALQLLAICRPRL